MSHIVEATTQIVNPDRELLLQAVQLVANQYEQAEVEQGVAEADRQTQLTTYYRNWSRRKVECRLGIFVPGLERGMGIVTGPQTRSRRQSLGGMSENEQEQQLKFVGDFYGCESLAQELQGQIVQTYISLATMRVLQQLGYQVEVAPVESKSENEQEAEAGAIQIRGVVYNV